MHPGSKSAYVKIFLTLTDLHFMHNSGSNQEVLAGTLQGMLPAWNRYSVLLFIHVSIYDMILTAYEDTGRTVESVRRSELTTGNLNQKVGPRVRRLAPFAYDMIQTEIKLVIRQHLDSLSVNQYRLTNANRQRTFCAFFAASPDGSWSTSP
jgi:hypothetical protein